MKLKAILVIDMQIDSFLPGSNKFDPDGVVKRINNLTRSFRKASYPVIHVQHDGSGSGEYEMNTPGWKFIPGMVIEPDDMVISKKANDAFYQTDLQKTLDRLSITELYITGSATDFCVDATIQSALVKDYRVTVLSDCHTTGNKLHLPAEKIIEHYNFIWRNLIPTKGFVQVLSSNEIQL